MSKPVVGKEHMIGDSIDRELKNVDSQLFQSKGYHQAKEGHHPLQTSQDSNLNQISTSHNTAPIQHKGAVAQGQTGVNQTASTTRRQQQLQNINSVAATIDDSEFYRSTNMVDNTKDTIVETNIKGVLEKHMASTSDHRPCKVPFQLYEKLPMMKEGIYLKDFKPQDMNISKPHYGDANNPYENFIPQHPPATDNSLYRRDFTSKQLRNTGEPVIRDVISSQHDFAKHLKAPKPSDSLYKVLICNDRQNTQIGVLSLRQPQFYQLILKLWHTECLFSEDPLQVIMETSWV